MMMYVQIIHINLDFPYPHNRVNYTDAALTASEKQLAATIQMTWQKRQALDLLLAKWGGVCVMFGSQCCTFKTNNTAPSGAFTEARKKLRVHKSEVQANVGRD